MVARRKIPYSSTCLHCGKDFETYPSRKGQKFCSNDCRMTHYQSAYITKICKGCSKPFQLLHARDHQLYCSKQCYFDNHEKSAPVIKGIKNCVICGNEFKEWHEGVKCCSAECRKVLISQKPHKSKTKRPRKQSAPQKPRMPKFVEQICVICGTTFQAKKRNGNPLSQTCSMKCRVDKRLKTINVAPPTAKICKQCGKEFTVPKKYDKEHTMYCSNACRIANLPKGHVANPENTEIKHCLICGKPMKVIRCLRNRKKFCSDVCRQASPNKGKKPDPNLTVMRTCLECGKPIAVKRRLLNRKKFCSHSCSARHNVRKQATIRPTSIEVALYQALDLLGVPYIKQHSVKNYVFDAWLPDHKTIIEADGTYWHSLPDRQERDKKLAVYAKHMGYVLIRLDEMFIKSLDIQGLAEHIKQQLP